MDCTVYTIRCEALSTLASRRFRRQ